MQKLITTNQSKLLLAAIFLVLAQFTSYGQEARDITGTVKDQSGEGLPGATVKASGSSNGVVTDANGAYRISATTGSILTATYIGFKTSELRVGASNVYNFVLTSDNVLNNVVVTGYGVQKKRDLSGSQSTIGEDAIKSVPVMSADQAIQGRAAGVQVQMSSGAPGGAVQVRIRGTNSMAGKQANQPLYVVDGVPLFYSQDDNNLTVGNEGTSGGTQSNSASPLNTISPNDIESMEILKDASSTAIYGARAANGVVLITTKRGKVGQPVVSINAQYAAQSLRSKVPVANAQERAQLVYEHRRNRGTNANDVYESYVMNPFAWGKGTDWQDEVFRTAPMQNYNLSVNGGSDKITYNVSGDWMDQQGILVNTFSKRANTRINVDINASDKFRIGSSTALSSQWGNEQKQDEFFNPNLSYLLQTSPLQPVYLEDGSFSGQPDDLVSPSILGGNPLADFLLTNRRATRNRAISNIYGEYSITPDFKFKSSANIDYLSTTIRSIEPIFFRQRSRNETLSVNESVPRTLNWLLEQTLQYSHQFGDHAVTAIGGFSAQNISVRTLFASGRGSTNNALDQLGSNNAVVGNTAINGGITNAGLVSQFIRGTYNYKGKYLATATARRDGSSRFGKNKKYGIFPSGSIGWRISEENFFKDNIKGINEFKLRASYGVTGSQDIGNFLYLPLTQSQATVFENSLAATSLAPNRFQNDDIQWERTTALDLGIDIGLLQGRVNITADYYDKLTDGLIGIAPLSVISGVGNSFQTNIASVTNKGYEFAIDARILDKQDLKWNLGFNISTNQNRVKSLGPALTEIRGASINRIGGSAPINRTVPGKEIGAFWLLEQGPQYLTFADASNAPHYYNSGQFFVPEILAS
jgi:TonB-linked SusC/RagA family outer membrane protein